MTVVGELDDQYLGWLIHSLGAEDYSQLCFIMQKIVFDTSVPNDDNRAAEGKDLRRQFLEMNRFHKSVYYMWLAPPASIFETLAALTAHAEFMTSIPKNEWFMIFLSNLQLDGARDVGWTNLTARRAMRALEAFNNRRYLPDGRGGLFPIENPEYDMRTIEIWYQMCAFIQQNQMY